MKKWRGIQLFLVFAGSVCCAMDDGPGRLVRSSSLPAVKKQCTIIARNYGSSVDCLAATYHTHWPIRGYARVKLKELYEMPTNETYAYTLETIGNIVRCSGCHTLFWSGRIVSSKVPILVKNNFFYGLVLDFRQHDDEIYLLRRFRALSDAEEVRRKGRDILRYPKTSFADVERYLSLLDHFEDKEKEI